jgi:glycosyltransferase involved in cell wall biosynthesis
MTREGRLRVLWVTASLGGGGAEMHLVRLLNAFDRREFEPVVAVARAGGSYERLLASDVPVLALTHGARSCTGSVATAIPHLRALIRKLQPSVLCSIMDHVNVAAVLATRGMSARPPLVLCVQIDPTAAYYHDSSPLSAVIRFGIRRLYHRADRVLAPSYGVARELVSHNARLSHMVDVIPNASTDHTVDESSRTPASRESVPDGERLVVACGRLAPQKGFHQLLDAIAAVRKVVPVHVWILGEGPEHGSLVDKARALGIVDSVRFLGFQDRPSRFLAAADVFVLSSLSEGFGNVVVEAMASGVPVVASDCAHGPGEIITDGVDGLLVGPGDANSLAAGILRVFQNSTLAADLVRNGRNRAAHFHASLIADQYAAVIRRLAHRGRESDAPVASLQRSLGA